MPKEIDEKDSGNYTCPVQPMVCNGSKCMVWQWKPLYKQVLSRTQEVSIVPNGFSNYIGYCGMIRS